MAAQAGSRGRCAQAGRRVPPERAERGRERRPGVFAGPFPDARRGGAPRAVSRWCATGASCSRTWMTSGRRGCTWRWKRRSARRKQGFESLCARIDDPALRDLAIRKVASGEFDMNQERIVADGVRRIRQRALRKKTELVSAELRKAGKRSGGSRAAAGAPGGEDASGQRAGKTEDGGGRGLKTKVAANKKGTKKKARRSSQSCDEQGAGAARRARQATRRAGARSSARGGAPGGSAPARRRRGSRRDRCARASSSSRTTRRSRSCSSTPRARRASATTR